MTDDDLIHRLTALRQQLDQLTADLTAYLHPPEHRPPGAATDLQMVGQIHQVQRDIADLQVDLGHAEPARLGTLRDRDLVLSMDAREAERDQRSDHWPLVC